MCIPIGEMRIVDMESGKPVPTNAMGILQIRGGNVMKEYVNNPSECPNGNKANSVEANKEAFTDDGWFDTGDVGLMDEDGLLYLRDRGRLGLNAITDNQQRI